MANSPLNMNGLRKDAELARAKGYTINETENRNGTPVWQLLDSRTGEVKRETKFPDEISSWAAWPKVKDNGKEEIARSHASRTGENKSDAIPTVDPEELQRAIAFLESKEILVEQDKDGRYILMSPFGAGKLFDTMKADQLIITTSFIQQGKISIEEEQMKPKDKDPDSEIKGRAGEDIYDKNWPGQYRKDGPKVKYIMKDISGKILTSLRKDDTEWMLELVKGTNQEAQK